MKIKKSKSKLGMNLIRVVPLVEEITNEKMLPFCLIGFGIDKNKKISVRFATLSDGPSDKVLFEICKQLVESKPPIPTKPQPNAK